MNLNDLIKYIVGIYIYTHILDIYINIKYIIDNGYINIHPWGLYQHQVIINHGYINIHRIQHIICVNVYIYIYVYTYPLNQYPEIKWQMPFIIHSVFIYIYNHIIMYTYIYIYIYITNNVIEKYHDIMT